MKQSFLSNDRIYLRAVEPEDMGWRMTLPCGISVILPFLIPATCSGNI